MMVWWVVLMVLLLCGNGVGWAIWRELREMRRRAGLLPPKRLAKRVRGL